MKRFHLIVGLAFLSSFTINYAFSQESLSPEISVLPPSPEVVAMNKFTEIPVSYYTGLPQISIPIHDIMMEKIKVPISLDYHASGLRVDEYASWVGAGWSLKGAGVISRTIRGRADERDETPNYKGYFFSSDWMDSNGNLIDGNFNDCSQSREQSVPPTAPEYSPINPSDFLTTGVWDTQPDKYNYSYPGGGGKFTFNNVRDLILLTPDDIYIDHPYDFVTSNMYLTDYSWEIGGAEGNKYFYENMAETTISSNPCASIGGDGIPMPDLSVNLDQTSWFLTKIENGKEWVNYSYDALTVTDSVKISETERFQIAGPGQNSSTTCHSYRTRNTHVLKSISTSDGFTIEFIRGNARNDLSGSFNLDKILVKYLGQTIKIVDLDNDGYFGNNAKLKLSNVEIQDANSTTVNKYDLTYHGGTFPDRQTPKQDYWGFYNGAIANSISMVPEWWNDDYHVNINAGRDRDPSLSHTLIGTLKKITYPTGGSSSFDYELHDYSGANAETQYSYSVVADGDQNFTDKDSVVFSVSHDCSVTMHYGDIPDGLSSFAGLKKKNPSTQIYESYTPSTRSGIYGGNAMRKNLESGDYILWAESYGEPIDLEIFFEQKGQADFQRAGGLRIKNITIYDPETDSTTHTIFNYTLDSELKSSGKLMTNPYRDGYYTTYIPGIMVNNNCVDKSQIDWEVRVNVASYAQIPLGSVQGSHVGYSRVNAIKVSEQDLINFVLPAQAEYQPDYGNWPNKSVKNGKVSFGYINDYPQGGANGYNTNYPFVPFPDLDVKNGQLLDQKTYKNVNNVLILQREVLNSYDTLDTETLKTYVFSRPTSTFCYSCSTTYNEDNTYLDKGRKTRLIKTIDRSYENGKIRELITEYEYDYPTHLQLAASFTTESNGDVNRTEYVRHPSYPALITRLDKLVNGSMVESSSLNYLDNLPSKFFKWDGVSSYDLATSIYRNGSSGLIVYTTSHPHNGGPPTKTTYLYSHGDAKKPVAQIQNLDTTEVDLKLAQINASYNRNWLQNNTNEVEIANTLEALRLLLGSTEVMTYYLYEANSIAFGPTKIVDQNGVSQKFGYDTFGRLEHVFDQDGNLVRKVTYNLKNQ